MMNRMSFFLLVLTRTSPNSRPQITLEFKSNVDEKVQNYLPPNNFGYPSFAENRIPGKLAAKPLRHAWDFAVSR